MRTHERGSSLVITVVVIMVLTVIGIGIIRFSAREAAGARSAAQEESLVACAEAGRQALMNQFHVLGMQPTAITALQVGLDNPNMNVAMSRVYGGHYDHTVQLGQVTYLPESAFGPTNSVRDLSNTISATGQGGRPMKVVVHCQQSGSAAVAGSGRQLEVEFGVRFGL